MEQSFIFGSVLAILLGALIGVERELPRHSVPGGAIGFGGIRSYALISLLGAISVWLDGVYGGSLWTLIGATISGVFIVASYVYSSFQKSQPGVTSEYAAIITYMIGILAMKGQYNLAVILTIFVMIVLSSKDYIRIVLQRVSRAELGSTLKFAVIALVILPILPNEKFAFSDILRFFSNEPGLSLVNMCSNGVESFKVFLGCFWDMKFFNPYSIWKFVVLMTAVEFAGYVLSKIIGSKAGIIASGAIGGLVSSTAVTAAMSKKSTEDAHNTDSYVIATLIANAIMFLRVLAITGFVASGILGMIFIPALAMFGAFFGFICYFLYLTGKKNEKELLEMEDNHLESPFQIIPALKFAIFIIGIKFISALIQLLNIKSMYVPFAIVSGLADVDAPTLEFATLGKNETVTLFFAGILILIAVVSNNSVKGYLAWRFGSAAYSRKVVITFISSAFFGAISIILLYLFSPALVEAFSL